MIKKSSSGKQFQFIADDGVIYFTSLTWMKNFLYSDQMMIELKRYAVPVPDGKFKKSEVYDPTGAYAKLAAKSSTGRVDTMKKEVTKDIKEEEQYNAVVTEF